MDNRCDLLGCVAGCCCCCAGAWQAQQQATLQKTEAIVKGISRPLRSTLGAFPRSAVQGALWAEGLKTPPRNAPKVNTLNLAVAN